ncbi:hypothetical protein RCH16_002669 [Cryobacterium sp. MP_M5]|uniref:DUF2071 domain-containing protein n=1 Tax=unclassified Cryobacterium TaxID=2649013 RepID=UPI0018CA691F|nr:MULTISPECIES: DUF2071 domain-containing protein [unclassified Cryobacterium]MBG6059372.1 hypothetical protein [Cryobacterium sp. MP_M3]MEC5177649.1 hypothetical protein [Cryobacterium sp. MP_M5]
MRIPLPTLAATIERRLLINYRVDPAVAQSLLPASLRPQLVDGSAVAGICLLRLGALRPAWFTPPVGWGAENAAHRVAVEWDDAAGTHSGVYIPERHSASRLPVAVGGRLFPGVHTLARFHGSEQFDGPESGDRIRLSMTAPNTTVRADVRVGTGWTSTLFETVADASAFFRNGAVGWSPSRDGRRLEGLRLDTTAWAVQPGEALTVESSFFDALPDGSATLDSMLVMRNVPITWTVPAGVGPAGPATATAATTVE